MLNKKWKADLTHAQSWNGGTVEKQIQSHAEAEIAVETLCQNTIPLENSIDKDDKCLSINGK